MGFDAAYRSPEAPPWDIGAPQPAIVGLVDAGAIVRAVVDLGCGTGENAILLAAAGHPTLGVDSSPTAIERARRKAAERGSVAEFSVADVLDLSSLNRRFRTAIDVGCFHVFDDADRVRYVRSVGEIIEPGGRLHLLCFSELQPGVYGPRRVSQAEIRAAFEDGWDVVGIGATRFAARSSPAAGADGAAAWLATIERA